MNGFIHKAWQLKTTQNIYRQHALIVQFTSIYSTKCSGFKRKIEFSKLETFSTHDFVVSGSIGPKFTIKTGIFTFDSDLI